MSPPNERNGFRKQTAGIAGLIALLILLVLIQHLSGRLTGVLVHFLGLAAIGLSPALLLLLVARLLGGRKLGVLIERHRTAAIIAVAVICILSAVCVAALVYSHIFPETLLR